MYDYIIVLFLVLVNIKSTIYVTFVKIAQKRGVNFVFYELLKKICDEKGIKITPLVLSCGGSKGMLSGWKQGASPNVDMLVKLSDTLNCSMDYLMGRNTHDTYSVTQIGTGNVNGDITNSNLNISGNSVLSEYEADIIRIFRSLPLKEKHKVMTFMYDTEEKNKDNL